MDFLNNLCFEDLELQNNFRIQFNITKIDILNLCANNTEETGVGSLVWKVKEQKKSKPKIFGLLFYTNSYMKFLKAFSLNFFKN